MIFRCKHDWRFSTMSYNLPTMGKVAWMSTDDNVLRILYGFTNITYVCTKCPKVRVSNVPGRAEPPVTSDLSIGVST